mmetsp:Transcript_920/g.1478  ORF Transcript_920/g.1478 Transcript_920/m.1478 type:complete len:476 (-) Transcript_920:520-1947(-)
MTKRNDNNNESKPKNNVSFFKSQRLLLTAPILSLIAVAALDEADKKMLSSSFPALEQTLHLDVKMLGYFSLFSNLSYALSVPLWGYAVHVYGMSNIHNLLSLACMVWGLSTIGIAYSGANYVFQALFRCVNGAALASILPLSQTLLVELVSFSMRGRAFGLMMVCEKIAGTLATVSVVYFDRWQNPYYVLGIFSVLMSVIIPKNLKITSSNVTRDETDNPANKMTMRQIIQRIVKIPAFICLVAQGIFGGTPWDMMSFLLLLFDWRGFTKEQIVSLQFSIGISGTIGSWLGGYLGDYFAMRYPSRGRIYVALISVSLHVPTYGMLLYATEYKWAMLWYNLFYLTATWTPVAAIKPICAELAQNTSERAQIVSMWILIEKTSNAVFGAPLVGYLTSGFIAEAAIEKEHNGTTSSLKAQSLAFSLLSLSALFWGICGVCWLIMAFTFDTPKAVAAKQDTGQSKQDEDDEEMAGLKLQ